jgi:hypothetical protein
MSSGQVAISREEIFFAKAKTRDFAFPAMVDSDMGEAMLERKQAVYRNLVTSLPSLTPISLLYALDF